MDNVGLAYIAGFFDGEGCIYVVKMKTGYSLRLEINQREDGSDILHFICSTLGGSIYHKRATFQSNPYARWAANGDLAINILNQLLPYLRLKKFQAEVAVNYSNSMTIEEKETIRLRLQDMKVYKGA